MMAGGLCETMLKYDIGASLNQYAAAGERTYILLPIGAYCGYESDWSWGLWSLVVNLLLIDRVHTMAEIINW
jgi:hypothetical protein